MALTPFDNICVACDTEFVFPAVEQNQDCNDYIYESQIEAVIISPKAKGTTGKVLPFSDWDTHTNYAITATTANFDNTAGDNTKCIRFCGIGGVAVPDKTVVRVAKRRDKTLRRRYTLELRIPNLTHQMRELLRGIQCNPTDFTFWYENERHQFGENDGIIPVFADADLPLGAGEGDIEEGVLMLIFEAKVAPERRINPF